MVDERGRKRQCTSVCALVDQDDQCDLRASSLACGGYVVVRAIMPDYRHNDSRGLQERLGDARNRVEMPALIAA